MSNTAKVSISVSDPDLLKWAKQRSKILGVSLSSLFTSALRFERQLEARRVFLETEGLEGRATQEEMAEIRAEWDAHSRTANRSASKRKR